MRGVCDFTDFFVIATGRNARQTKAIYDEVAGVLKKEHQLLPRSTAGVAEATWIVADYLDVVLHLFTPETRASTGSRSCGATSRRSSSSGDRLVVATARRPVPSAELERGGAARVGAAACAAPERRARPRPSSHRRCASRHRRTARGRRANDAAMARRRSAAQMLGRRCTSPA